MMQLNPTAPTTAGVREIYDFILSKPECRHSIRDIQERFVGERVLGANHPQKARIARMVKDARDFLAKARHGHWETERGVGLERVYLFKPGLFR
jgi:hypothetical protein